MKRRLYVVFATGTAGSNMMMLYVGDGIIAGADSGMGRYDGSVEETPGGGLRGTIHLSVPPGRPLITGGVAPSNVPAIPIPFELPSGFDKGNVVALQTPLGPLNLRFEILRDLP